MKNSLLTAAEIARATLPELTSLRLDPVWPQGADARTVEAFARRALQIGEPLLAWDVLEADGSKIDFGIRLAQLSALALLRVGAVERAIGLLEPLRAEGAADEETLGLLARGYKALWLESADANHLRRSIELYSDAYQATAGVWSGINAATLNLCAGEASLAQTLARAVQETCTTLVASSGAKDPWLIGTLGEAALILRNVSDAQRWYRELGNMTRDHGTRASVRANARLVLGAIGENASWMDDVIPGPMIGVFSGHVAKPGPDGRGRLFGEPEQAIVTRIAQAVDRLDIRIGFGAAAAGADIIFHEAVLARGGECHIVLPQAPENFKDDSVAPAGGDWLRRFDTLLMRAARTVVLGESAADDLAYVYANRGMLGLARAHSQQVDGRLRGLALWDGAPGPAGGTSSAIADWRSAELELVIVEVAHRSAAQPGAPGIKRLPRRIVSMLFADAVGFSKLADAQIPAFMDIFLGGVARTLQESGIAPLYKNTWGDGLYLCFGSTLDAGRYSLVLRDYMNSVDWSARGLPAGMNVRIGLHCGPAYEMFDPVTGRTGYSGAHVSRAARIEPITPPGEVFASQDFAMMAHYERSSSFRCEYVGNMPQAKGYGQYATYSVRPSRSSA